SQVCRRRSERSQVDTVNRCFVLFQSREATQNSRQNNHWGRTQQRLTFLLSAVFYYTALEQTGRSGQNGVTRFGFFLVTHAQVTARTLQVQLVFVLGTGFLFRVVVIEDEASVFRQNVPIAFGFQLVNDVVRRWCNNQRRFEGDRTVLFQVTQHGSDDLHVAFVNHTRTNEAQIHFTAIVVRSRTDHVVGVTLGYVFVVYVRVGNHRLVDDVQVYHHFGVVLGVVVRSQSRLFTRLDASNTLVSQGDQAFQHAGFVVHAFVDHDLDTGLAQFQRLDQGVIGRNTDRSFRFHFCSPVGEGEGLVSQQGADLYVDHAALEYVFAVELLQHLRLSGVYDVTEVHVRLHLAFEGYLHRLRDRHSRFTSGQGDRNGTGVRTERHTFRHTGVRVTTDDDRAVVHSNVVQYFVDYVGHGVVNAFRVTCSDYTECVHESHQLRRVGLGFVVPYRGS